MIQGQLLPDTSKEAIGARLVAVRVARGLTQGALAQSLDVSPQRWFNYERGNNVPPPDILARLWQVTGVTSDYILFGRLDGMPNELARALQTQAPRIKSA